MNALLTQDEIDGLHDDPAPGQMRLIDSLKTPTIIGADHVIPSAVYDRLYRSGEPYLGTMAQGAPIYEVVIIDDVEPLLSEGLRRDLHQINDSMNSTIPSDALLHGIDLKDITYDISPFGVVEAFFTDKDLDSYVPLNAPGRIIDGGEVSITIDTGAWTKSVATGGAVDSDPEFFIDQSPDGLWYLVPDANRIAWNDWCVESSGLTGKHPTQDEDERLIAPDFAKPLPAHPRWTVFKSPRQKFS